MDKNSYIVAIDLGSDSVKAAVGSREQDGKLHVLDVVTKAMDADGMVRGEVMNLELAAAATREAVSELEGNLGIKITEAYAGASGQDIKCVENSYFVFVTGEDGEIRETDVAKLHESMNNLQPPEGIVILDRIPQKYVIDNHEETIQPVGRFGHQLEATYNFILGNKNSLERMFKVFKRLNIQQIKTYTNAQASAAAVLTDDEKELGAAVINIGGGCSDICIWQDNKLRHTGVIPVGSDAINRDIRSIAIPDRFIEKLKVTHGYAMADRIPDEKRTQTIKIKGRNQRETKEVSFYNLAQIIEARVTDIVEHALEEIKDAGYTDKLGAGIVLTGGGALLKDIDALFRERTKYDVRLGATEHSLVSDDSFEFADDMRFTTVVGLLLMGLAESDIAVSEHTGRQTQTDTAQPQTGPQDYVVTGDNGANSGGGKKDTGTTEKPTVRPGKVKTEKPPKKEKKKFRFGKIFTDIFEIVDDEEID